MNKFEGENCILKREELEGLSSRPAGTSKDSSADDDHQNVRIHFKQFVRDIKKTLFTFLPSFSSAFKHCSHSFLLALSFSMVFLSSGDSTISTFAFSSLAGFAFLLAAKVKGFTVEGLETFSVLTGNIKIKHLKLGARWQYLVHCLDDSILHSAYAHKQSR